MYSVWDVIVCLWKYRELQAKFSYEDAKVSQFTSENLLGASLRNATSRKFSKENANSALRVKVNFLELGDLVS